MLAPARGKRVVGFRDRKSDRCAKIPSTVEGGLEVGLIQEHHFACNKANGHAVSVRNLRKLSTLAEALTTLVGYEQKRPSTLVSTL